MAPKIGKWFLGVVVAPRLHKALLGWARLDQASGLAWIRLGWPRPAELSSPPEHAPLVRLFRTPARTPNMKTHNDYWLTFSDPKQRSENDSFFCHARHDAHRNLVGGFPRGEYRPPHRIEPPHRPPRHPDCVFENCGVAKTSAAPSFFGTDFSPAKMH